LLGCSALLAGVLLLQLRTGPPRSDVEVLPSPAATADVTSLAGKPAPFPPLQEFSEIVERPLFDGSRRPFEPPEPTAQTAVTPRPPPPTPPPRITLIGVVITPQSRSALLLDELRRELIRASVGTSVSGWELSEVSPEGVVLRQGQRTHRLDLIENDNKGSNTSSYRPGQRQISQK
jgi:hypothetical protein